MKTRARGVLLTVPIQVTAPDTVVMRMARDGLDTAAAVSLVVVGVFFLLLVPLLLLILLQVRKVNRTVKELGEKGLRRADPLLERGKGIADNLEFVSMAVRTDVEKLTTSVKTLARRLEHASDRMEQRVAEFNALMEVVQSEAEDLFVGTAATVRGVRAGARSLQDGPDSRPEVPPGFEQAEASRPRDAGEAGEEGAVYVSRPTEAASRRSGPAAGS